MKSPILMALIFIFPLLTTQNLLADDSTAPARENPAASEATSTPVPKPTVEAKKNAVPALNSKMLVIHKPMPSPSWGKVIQYHRQEIYPLSENNRETLHEFLFQDDQGIIRTAIFHENASGDGYWEVWVWDQPQ